jgi:hypothetical protein
MMVTQTSCADTISYDGGAFCATANHVCSDILESIAHFQDGNGRFSSPAARYLIWPLRDVAACLIAPRATRQLAIEYLRRIGDESHNLQAMEAARMFRRSDMSLAEEDW